ncbi:MAG: AraC family transcriptional regulator [Chitinophagaceae bacterium]|nr:MAG: AraC family transcriptional regulator [Chitinophagaceae bacterium]
MMTPEYIAVPLSLARQVTAMWHITGSDTIENQHQFITMADGCPGLVFQDPASGFMYFGEKNLSPLYLYGQATRASGISVIGKFDAIGVCLHPTALKRLFRIAADSITDSCVPVHELIGGSFRTITEKLVKAPDNKERASVLHSFLENLQTESAVREDQVTETAVDEIVASAGWIKLPDLQKRLHITERSLERRFRDHVGLSPNMFARICRFQDTMRLLRSTEYTKLSDIAYDSGYADQSHFIRTFRAFAGCSPNQYLKRSVALIDSFPEVNELGIVR